MKDLFKYKNKTVEIICDNGDVIKGVVNISYDINYSPILKFEGLQNHVYPENVNKIKIIKNYG